MTDWRIPEGLHRCPTCGKFIALDEGYGDQPPGGVEGLAMLAVYCDSDCADRKSPSAIYEGTPEMDVYERG